MRWNKRWLIAPLHAALLVLAACGSAVDTAGTGGAATTSGTSSGGASSTGSVTTSTSSSSGLAACVLGFDTFGNRALAP